MCDTIIKREESMKFLGIDIDVLSNLIFILQTSAKRQPNNSVFWKGLASF